MTSSTLKVTNCVIEVGQGDIAPSAVLRIPALDAVVAGDVADNQIHQMLALGGPAEWDKWIASIGMIERLHPRIFVAGHKKPEAPYSNRPTEYAEGVKPVEAGYPGLYRSASWHSREN
jgi:hypothetical protein